MPNEMTISAAGKTAEPEERFQWLNFLVILSVHLLAVVGLCFYSLPAFFVWLSMHIFFGAFGIVIGFHRYFAHSAFQTNKYFEYFLALIGTLTFQGGPIFWIAAHRIHHLLSEKEGDPHSATRGFLWSHILWLFYSNPNGYSHVRALRMVPDIREKKFLQWLERNHLLLNLSALSGAFILFAVILQRPEFFFWGFPIRIVTNWHSTWMLNSYTHSAWRIALGKNPILLNSYLLQIPQLGDGFHLNHHDRPSSAATTTKWYQMDLSYGILLVLQRLKVVRRMRVSAP